MPAWVYGLFFRFNGCFHIRDVWFLFPLTVKLVVVKVPMVPLGEPEMVASIEDRPPSVRSDSQGEALQSTFLIIPFIEFFAVAGLSPRVLRFL